MTNQPKNTPILHKDEIDEHPDSKIDQDFKGYPHGSAKDEIIHPETSEEKKIADLDNKDGEKRRDNGGMNNDEQDSEGSANAFDDK